MEGCLDFLALTEWWIPQRGLSGSMACSCEALCNSSTPKGIRSIYRRTEANIILNTKTVSTQQRRSIQAYSMVSMSGEKSSRSENDSGNLYEPHINPLSSKCSLDLLLSLPRILLIPRCTPTQLAESTPKPTFKRQILSPLFIHA